MPSKQIGKRKNDGDNTGLKQDRYRNSRFEYEDWRRFRVPRQVSSKTQNMLGGAYEENRGRRVADDRFDNPDNPFEEGEVNNWNYRKGWDKFFDQSYDKEANRNRGGALRYYDGAHRGKGPKGYSRADERIHEDVCEALTLSSQVDASEIDVQVREGIVYLEGFVESREEKKMAEYAIEDISGVHDVQNFLSINPQERSAEGRQ